MKSLSLRRLLPALAFAAAAIMPSQASAALYLFTLTGPNTASFSIDSSPVPDSFDASSFNVNSVTGTFNGAPTLFASLTFYDTANFGGFRYTDSTSSVLLDLFGSQLFTGTLNAPTFSLGSYPLNAGEQQYTLNIGEGGAVPEPATWAMMLLGFGGIGLAMRRARVRFARA